MYIKDNNVNYHMAGGVEELAHGRAADRGRHDL